MSVRDRNSVVEAVDAMTMTRTWAAVTTRTEDTPRDAKTAETIGAGIDVNTTRSVTVNKSEQRTGKDMTEDGTETVTGTVVLALDGQHRPAVDLLVHSLHTDLPHGRFPRQTRRNQISHRQDFLRPRRILSGPLTATALSSNIMSLRKRGSLFLVGGFMFSKAANKSVRCECSLPFVLY